ncbi:MAG: ABC transporter permease [Planctomycetota bacterium]
MEIKPEEFLSFAEWFGPALRGCVIAIPILSVLALLVWYLISAARRGPVEGFYAVAGVVANAIGRDFPATSLQRVGAITRLTVKEAIRRKVLVGFVIFALIFLFAGWFLDVESGDPAHLYLSFVLTTTSYLVIVLSLLLATMSLPNDIKSKTMYTIVTKPVRATEVVLGRVFGFVAVISVLLVAMCLVSYMFVQRGLDHEHAVVEESTVRLPPASEGEQSPGWEGETTRQSHHRHGWWVGNEGEGETEEVMGHTHRVTRVASEEGEARYVLGEPTGALQARVPIYGKLRFRDRSGNPTEQGISVGKEWEYRSYIEGRTLATAIWTFEGITEENLVVSEAYPEGYLPIAMTLSVFRSHKGDIEEGVRGVVMVNSTNPRNAMQSEPLGFESKEFETKHVRVPRKLRALNVDGGSGQEVDLFDDLVEDGRLELWIRCDDPAQYFGMAQADLYVEAPDASFGWNFVKAYVTMWLQMVIVVCLGVMFSTFLSSPAAILATLAAVTLGFFGQFVRELWTGEAEGGGPVESLIRLVSQENMVQALQLDSTGIAVSIVHFVDQVLLTIMNALASVLPDFSGLGRAAQYVAYNYEFHNQLLARQCLTTFIYVTAITILGYFLLKTREIAA